MTVANRLLSLTLTAVALAACDAPRPPALVSPAAADLAKPAPDSFKVVFETSKGTFTVESHRAWAPNGVDRFHYLASNGFYNGTRFFRVMPGFVAQFGMHGDPAINDAWKNRTISDDPVTQSNQPGFVTFAMGGPNSRTSQLFINLGLNSRLDGMGFAPIGRVTDIAGMRVVAQLHGEYGDAPPNGHGPDQSKLAEFGNEYLTRWFPKLDSIVKATVVP